jgi:hypothetical protein
MMEDNLHSRDVQHHRMWMCKDRYSCTDCCLIMEMNAEREVVS